MNARESAGFTGPPTDRALYRISDYRSFRRGGVGVVYEATLTSERYGVAPGVAVGVKLLTGVDADRFAKLAERSHLLRSQPHPRLARHIECFVGPPVSPEEVPEEDANQFFSVHEWVSGISLHECIEIASVAEILAWAGDVAEALDHLHSLPGGGFAHRDVHARNIIVEPDGRARLIDFDTILWGEVGDTSLTSLQHGVARRPDQSALAGAQAQDRAALALTLLRALARDTTSGSPITELSRLSYANLEKVTPSRHELVATLIRAVQDPPSTAAELVETVRRHSGLKGRARRRRGQGSARKEMARLEAIATGTKHSRRVLPVAVGVLVLVSASAVAWAVAAPLAGDEKNPAAEEPTLTVPREALRASKVFAAGNRTCVVEAETVDLLCWGSVPQQHGSVANDAPPATWDSPIPQWMAGPDGLSPIDEVEEYAIGRGHTCALWRGVVECRGENDRGQLGTEPVGEFEPSSHRLWLKNVTEVDAAGDSSCAVTGGHVWCWGQPFDGDGFLVPDEVPGLDEVTALSMADDGRACVVQRGEVLCWGQFSADGDLDQPPTTEPARLPGIEDARSVSLNHSTVCAVAVSDELICLGANLWTGKDYGDQEHVGATTIEDVGPVTAVAVGASSLCVLTTAKTVRCLGGDHTGQLGLDGAEAGDVRTSEGVLSSVTSISAGADHTCAIRADKSVWCWGSGRNGQIGNGTTASQSRATRVELAVPDPGWLMEPGSYGPLRAGMQAGDAVKTGLVAALDPTASCDVKWDVTLRMARSMVHVEFRDAGDPSDLDFISVSSSSVKTRKGIHPGSSMDDLEAAYGDELQTHTSSVEGDGKAIFYLVFGKEGALGFVEDFERPGRVGSVFAASGTTLDDVVVPIGGC